MSTNTKTLNFFILFLIKSNVVCTYRECQLGQPPVPSKVSDLWSSKELRSSFCPQFLQVYGNIYAYSCVYFTYCIFSFFMWSPDFGANNLYPIFMIPTVSLVFENMFRITFYSLLLNYQHLKDNNIIGVKFDCSIQTCQKILIENEYFELLLAGFWY